MSNILPAHYCDECDKMRGALDPKKPNHILHLILSVLTGGLWTVVWAALSAEKRDGLCMVCGNTIPFVNDTGGRTFALFYFGLQITLVILMVLAIIAVSAGM